MTKGYLILETGEEFEGDWIGSEREIAGEVVFNTSMTGYQEMMTDPSYTGQILTFCYPIIGNYGVNEFDDESKQIAASAVIVSDNCDEPSHYQSRHSFSETLKAANIPGLKNVDTRRLVSAIRKYKTVYGKLVAADNKNLPFQAMDNSKLTNFVAQVSVEKPEIHGSGPYHVVLVDYGYKKSILQALLKNGCKVTIVPYYTTVEQMEALNPDGIVLSNGPGDPQVLAPYFSAIKGWTERYPTLGICLGHQLIALAYGGKTSKMPFGHRGGNHPVKDISTGKVSMTAQNHGYVVEEDSLADTDFQVLFRNVNDRSVEGIKHIKLPVQTVQFHPEAHPGPSDTAYIFEEFIRQVEIAAKKGVRVYA